MAQIGAIVCSSVAGFAPSLRARVDRWQIPGMSGYGAHVMGGGDAEFVFRALYCGWATDVEAWFYLLEQLQGTIVTVVNDYGVNYSNCLLASVTRVSKGPFRLPGAYDTRGEAQIGGVRIG